MTDRRLCKWAFVVLLLLVAWGLRIGWLEAVPPGWRDDELINIHALSNRLLEGEFPLYYLGASGHEPLYHHLHAGVLGVLGFNVLSGRLLSAMFGTLSISLTYTLARRLFPDAQAVANVAAATLAASFWSLMYSRTAIRHISLPPFILATVYAFWRRLDGPGSRPWPWITVGLLLAASLYTYTASRLLPVLLILFVGYLAAVHRPHLRRHWRGIGLAFLVMTVLVAPLGVAIQRGRSTRALEGIGADARVTELAKPLRALRDGDPSQLLASVVKTLGMFHASGDPEWLYNIPGRPIFGVLGGILLWLGVGLSLYRWREPRFFFLIVWLGMGLTPAFISTPPASLGHTIVAQPVAYLMPAVALVGIGRWVEGHTSTRVSRGRATRGARRAAIGLVLIAFVCSNAARDLWDYFVVWPRRGMVRLLYRADQRKIAEYLNEQVGYTDIAVGSGLMGPWDRIALTVDLERPDVAPRLFHPERALVWKQGANPMPVFLPGWPEPSDAIEDSLAGGRLISEHVSVHTPRKSLTSSFETEEVTFANGLTLLAARPLQQGREQETVSIITAWRVSEPLELPPMPVVAQPPPPKTYAGPRLAVFAHLLGKQGETLDVDDGLWVDPLTLRPGDRFLQIHRFSVASEGASVPSALVVGLYDPKTGERWQTVGEDGGAGAHRVTIPLGDPQ